MTHIKILEGSGAGKAIPLYQEAIVGRGRENAICLSDSRVSRCHARISKHDENFMIEDLHSSNGTLLRENRLFPGTQYHLVHGDKIRIGSTLMVFMDEEPESTVVDSKPIDNVIFEENYVENVHIAEKKTLLKPSNVSSNEDLERTSDNVQKDCQISSNEDNSQAFALRIISDDDSQPAVSASLDASVNYTEIDESDMSIKDFHHTAKRFQAICQVSLAIGTIKEQKSLMQKIVECIFDIFLAASRCFILTYETISDSFKLVIIKDRSQKESNNEDIIISKTIINEVKKQKLSILSIDTMNDARFNSKESVIDLKIRSMMCVPLLIGEEFLGLIQVDNYENHKLFSSEDLQILTGIGAQAAIAVKNAQLYHQVETETARRTSLQRYFSSSLVNMIMSDNVAATLGGKSYRGTILFADIIGFTTMSESMVPSDVLAKLNRYLTIMQKLIHQNGGNIDKVSGDSIMAFWGVPHTNEMDEGNAVLTALQMQKQIWSFNLELKDEGQQPINMGIGINTGDFIAGNIGSEDKIEFTLIGDQVNLASRIEHLSGRNQVLVSESTWKPIQHLVSAVKLPPLLVRGKSNLITIYSIRSMKSSQDGNYVMALPCHILNNAGLHVGSGIITGYTPLNSAICLHLCTSTSLICNDYVTLQMQTFEYHKPLLCFGRVDTALTGTHNGKSVYTKAMLTDIRSPDEESYMFFRPGSCVSTTYTWNDLKRR